MDLRTRSISKLLYSPPQNVITDKGISRPRVESSVTQHDRHTHRLIVDLISHRDKIFKDLKRPSIRKGRPESLDESHRRERYEARSRAVSAAAKSPRLIPADLANGSDKSPSTPAKRISGISGILGNRPPSLSLDPGDNVSLDGGALPVGGADDSITTGDTTAAAPVEVTVSDESGVPIGEPPIKKPSLGRSHRIGGRPTGLQRHIKRESIQQGESPNVEGDAGVNQRSSEGGRFAVTLTDRPT